VSEAGARCRNPERSEGSRIRGPWRAWAKRESAAEILSEAKDLESEAPGERDPSESSGW